MGLYEPISCCICFDTKNGSLILASLSLISAIWNILCAVFGPLAFYLDAYLEDLEQNHLFDGHDRHNIIVYVCIAVTAYYTFIGVCASLLIHGVRKDQPGLMMPYLIFQRFCIIIELITIFIGIVLALYLLNPAVFVFIVAATIAATIDIYFHLVINAYHKQLKRGGSEGTVYYKEFHNNANDSNGKV